MVVLCQKVVVGNFHQSFPVHPKVPLLFVGKDLRLGYLCLLDGREEVMKVPDAVDGGFPAVVRGIKMERSHKPWLGFVFETMHHFFVCPGVLKINAPGDYICHGRSKHAEVLRMDYGRRDVIDSDVIFFWRSLI